VANFCSWNVPENTAPPPAPVTGMLSGLVGALACAEAIAGRDGLNLVAMEGGLVNENDGVVVLSREAGVFDLLGESVLPVHPFDVTDTSDAMFAALEMEEDERRRRWQALRDAAERRGARDWLDDQVRAAQD
jgi:trehalose-6-phosphate synthase